MPQHEPAISSEPKLHASFQALVFRLADRTFALPAAAVREIVPFAQLSEPPGLPSEIAGFLQLGKSSLPVLRLSRLFGLNDVPPGLYTPLLILRTDEAPLALWVDAVEQIIVAGAATLVPLREGYALNDCVVGMLPVEAGHVLLLDEHRLLRREHERLPRASERQEATT